MNIKRLTDEKLVEEVLKNKQLFEEIINRYEKKILKYIYYLVGDKNEAEDIAQEVFIKTYINLAGFDKNLKFSSWLYRIAHNQAVNFLKKKKINLSFDEKIFLVESNQKVEEEITKKEIEKALKKCFQKLPVLYREIIDLYYFENLLYEEISDVLKIPSGTVAIRLSRAKKILKKLCQNKI